MPAVTDDLATDNRAVSPSAGPSATTESSPSRFEQLRTWIPPGERTLLALLLIGTAVVRLTGPGQLEPNVSTAEVSNLAAIEAILADRDPGLFAQSGFGASGLALLPAVIVRVVRPEPELALRLYSAIGSLLFVGLFYWLCRTRFPPVVSLATTALLAFSAPSIFLGRNGELNVFVAAWAVVAALALERALRSGTPRHWVLAGASATAALYWHPSGIWLLPALTVPIVWAAVVDPAARPRLTVALCVFLAAGLIVAAPRVPGLLVGPLSTSGMLAQEGAQVQPAAPVRVRAQQLIRAFFLLDPTVEGERRYQPAGQAPLDALTGLFLLGGLLLAAWRLPTRVLPLALALVPLAGSQLVSPRVPNLADAAVALPGLYLLVGEAIDRLAAVLPFPAITRAVMLVAIPAYAMFGWQAYSGWIGTAASAQARQPALDYDEVDAWAGEQHGRLVSGQPVQTAGAWRDEHPRLTTGSRAIRRPRQAGMAPAASQPAQLSLRVVGTIPTEGGPRAPRFVAATSDGEMFLADPTGRLSRLDPERNTSAPIQPRIPPLEQVADLAADADGFLYLADAERSLLVKLNAAGELVATLGADWGMYRPRGLFITPDNRILVADTGRNRIAVGTTDGRFQRSIVPPASFGTFEQPTEVAADPSGRIYVCLPEIGRLAILDESGQVLGGWTIPRGNTIESSRLTVVSDGAIAMTDPAQGRVQLLDADGRELASADAPGRPYGVAAANGRLFVSEPAAGRVAVFTLGP